MNFTMFKYTWIEIELNCYIFVYEALFKRHTLSDTNGSIDKALLSLNFVK